MSPSILVLGGTGLILLLFLIWPAGGVRRWIRNAVAFSRRQQAEDALKILLENSKSGKPVTAAALEGMLSLSPRRRIRLQIRLEGEGLIRTEGETILLTDEGAEMALHVLRAHRLWEHYLANEAQLPLRKVHRVAHHREHRSDTADLERMEARLGYPHSDPHGDPIPSRDGSLRNDRPGTPLTQWPKATPGVVVHLEDEPEVAYRALDQAGIRLGQILSVERSSARQVVVSDGVREIELAPAVATNVFLDTAKADEGINGIPLTSLRDGEQGQVAGIVEACQGYTRRRLLDLGLIPGTAVVPELSNAFGDPRAYRIRGTLIALRKEQASMVRVVPAGERPDGRPSVKENV